MQLKSALIGAAVGILTFQAPIAALAAPLQFAYTATVTGTDGTLSGVNVGSTVTGLFSYDSDTKIRLGSSGGPSSASSRPGVVTADVAGHTATSNLGLSIHIFQYGLALAGASPITVDGTAYTIGALNINLFSSDIIPGYETKAILPSSFNLADFDADASGVLTLNTLNATNTIDFNITSISAVPEPDTVMMILFGLGGLSAHGAFRRRMTC
jgi:hypothetical protein